jgi:hypothetical protein
MGEVRRGSFFLVPKFHLGTGIKKDIKTSCFEPSLTIQKLDLIELFIIRVKRKTPSRKTRKAAKQMHVF